MHFNVIKISTLAFCAALSLALATQSAGAVTITTTGSGASGSMADGPTWTAGPNTFGFPTWTVPLSNNEFPEFNAAGISNGAGNFATEVDFFYTGTQPNSFNTDFDTGFTHVNTPEGQVWDTDFVSSDEVIFKAVNGDKLVPGSLYSMLVGFINPIDPSGFSFRVVFTDGSQTSDVPEPSSLALFGAGLVMLAGFMFRRRSTLS